MVMGFLSAKRYFAAEAMHAVYTELFNLIQLIFAGIICFNTLRPASRRDNKIRRPNSEATSREMPCF